MLLTIFLAFNAFAKPRGVFVCLGQEEKFYHQEKISGPFYSLNQVMISEFLQMEPSVKLRPGALKEVCQKEKHPSLKILKALMLERHQFFKVPNDLEELQSSLAKKSVDSLIRRTPDIFWEFIAGLQAFAPTVNCLEQNIPELKGLKTKSLYLEEELTQEVIFSNLKELKNVFKKIEKITTLFEECKKRRPVKK